jgi:oxygen-independent coproporphyrinogen-3 oxidase
VRTPERYIELVTSGRSAEAAREDLDAGTRRIEGLQLSLRTRDGVPADALDRDELGDLVEEHGERLVLTRAGRLLANEVALRLR